MTTIMQKFIADRAKRAPVTNDSQPVTRAEFNTLVQAVHGLIEDFEAATSPEKLAGAFNAALKEAIPTTNAQQNRYDTAGIRGKYLLPPDDDSLGNIMPPRPATPAMSNNAKSAARPPLALPADRGYRLPEGD